MSSNLTLTAILRYRGMVRCLIALLCLTATVSLPGQTIPSHSLAGLVLSETPWLDAAPDFAAWRNLHPKERLINAAYGNEYESQGRWCIASAADFSFPDGVKATRHAFFYIPFGASSDRLPAREDAGLLRQCRLLALWYEVSNPVNSGALSTSISAELGASLGPPNELTRFAKRDGDWGSGYWNPYRVWERPSQRVVLAVDPGGPLPDDPRTHKRLLVIARSPLAPRGLSFDWNGELPADQPTAGNTSESASIARLGKLCSFDDGHNNWLDGLARFGEKLLVDFPSSRSTPFIHLTLGRAYAASLILTYPGVELNGAKIPGDPDERRSKAITHFRAFLEDKRESPEANSAWKEAWRLLAGLPPSPIHLGCVD